jgi:hypothetical protein
MAIPKLTPDQIAQVSGLVAQYIAAQREKYVSRAMPLSAKQRTAVNGFFSTQLLEGTRVVVLQGERVANPDFYPMLKSLGFNNLPDQSTMGAITFSDVVVSHVPFTDGLFFHELVHTSGSGGRCADRWLARFPAHFVAYLAACWHPPSRDKGHARSQQSRSGDERVRQSQCRRHPCGSESSEQEVAGQ